MLGVVAQRIGKLPPTPSDAWEAIVAQSQQSAPLIAVEIAPPQEGFLSYGTCGKIADDWCPRFPELWFSPDLGRNHKIVAIICLIEFPRHYVVFCRQQRQPTHCLLFNEALRELSWHQVPAVCQAYGLQPRLILYESDQNVSLSFRDAARRGDSCAQM